MRQVIEALCMAIGFACVWDAGVRSEPKLGQGVLGYAFMLAVIAFELWCGE